MVVPEGRGGAVDHELAGLSEALDAAFKIGHMPRHFEKLQRTNADERHLFVALHLSALPSSVMLGLSSDELLPPYPPPLPDNIASLWLAPPYSRHVLQWARGNGWTNHYPYDN
jgi:hypothetical protein